MVDRDNEETERHVLASLITLLVGATPAITSAPLPMAGRTCGVGNCWSVPQPPPLQPSVFIAYAQIICGQLEAVVINYNEQSVRLNEVKEVGARLTTGNHKQFVRLISPEQDQPIESGGFRRSIYIARIDDPKPGNGSLDDGTNWHIDVVDTGFCSRPR